MTTGDPDEDEQACERCGQRIEPTYRDAGLCGDCYWDMQTDEDGSLG